MLVLGIESTCDETAAAVVKEGKEILSNVIFSQAEMHKKYGGVFPEVASRAHIQAITTVLEQALQEAGVTAEQIDLISVAKGPGLIGPLLIGLNTAKALALAWNKPFIGVNHVEAHLYAAMMQQSEPLLPALGVVISGGHTFLVLINEIGSYQMIGSTVDDAIGEAFDKVAALLNLPYPGGPSIEKLALEGDRSRYCFTAGKVKNKRWHFSFSGIKTNVFYTVKGQNGGKESSLSHQDRADVAASFQEAALQDIISKSLSAAKHYNCRSIYLGGGVSNNQRLRLLFKEQGGSLPIYWPPLGLSLDNAAMIAGLGFILFQKQKQSDPLDLQPMTRIPFGT